MSIHRSQEEIAVNRARYEEHQRKGLDFPPGALPGPSSLPAPPITPGSVLSYDRVPGGGYLALRLRRGEVVRVAATGRASSVALVCWRADETAERLNLADTAKLQWTTGVERGRVLFSDMGRVMLSVVEDSCGAHDVLVGGSTAAGNAARYGGAPTRNTRDNLVLAAAKLGLERRDIPPALSLFAPVGVDKDGALYWRTGVARGDDFADLRAEMDLLLALSVCPHPLDPEAAFDPAPVDVVRFRPGPSDGSDFCRSVSAEAVRGFENNAALFAGETR